VDVRIRFTKAALAQYKILNCSKVEFMHKKYKDLLLHLRLPFSYFLLPVFLFGLSQSLKIDAFDSLLLFICLHFFIYPASNVYNSYMDKDTGSIGALKNPPPVTSLLYKASIFLDLIAILIALWIDTRVMLLILPYIGISKAYSWKRTRLKKYPVTGWLAVVLFQGGYTFMLVSMVAEKNYTWSWFSCEKIVALVIATLLIGAYYPLTQIYQHAEDSERGDITISLKLGVTGTFIFTMCLFTLATAIASCYFLHYYNTNQFLLFIICLSPAIFFFFRWFRKSLSNFSTASFENAMKMTLISSTCLIICFGVLLFLNHF
jgi:1,4-dihydroxy-2-naphthoate octaprenyltransferase